MRIEQRKPALALLVAVTALGPLAFNILMPSMPGLSVAFAADYGTVQLTLSLYLVGFGISQLIYGPLSDRYGRRPVLIAGLALFLGGTVMSLCAATIEQLIVGRLLQAMGSCAGIVLVRAIVRDVYDRDQAASKIAYVLMAMIVAPMLAPLMGGLLDSWYDWRAGFILVGVAGLAVMVCVITDLPETNHRRASIGSASTIVKGYGWLLSSPVFRGYALQTAFGSGCFFGFMAGAPYLTIEVMAADPAGYGVALLLPGFAYMGAAFIAGRWSSRVGIHAMLEIGRLITLCGGVLFLIVALTLPLSIASLFVPMAIFAFGNGINLPNSMAGVVSIDPNRAGAASALAGFCQMTIGAGISALVGLVTTASATPMAAIVAACAVAQYLAYNGVRRAESGRYTQHGTVPAAQ